MTDFLLNLYKALSTFDIIYLIFTILSLIKCSRKGFVLSLLAASKWLLAYVVTLILFPKARPFLEGIIDNDYALDIILGIGIFILVIFIILMINKGINKFIEIGPGKVLSGLIKRIDKNVKITSINNESDIESLKI